MADLVKRNRSFVVGIYFCLACFACAHSQDDLDLNAAREFGKRNSSYADPIRNSLEIPESDLATFKTHIKSTLANACLDCHGPDVQEGNFRVDTLDPDLVNGGDIQWWLEVMNVVGNSEMPPPDSSDLSDEDRASVVNWLSGEIRVASITRRREKTLSSFRRLTRYEFSYALQDLLALPYDFGKDLPPETLSEDGFANSSDMLQMSTVHFGYFRELALRALKQAVVDGPQPQPVYYSISMRTAAEKCNPQYVEDLAKAQKDFAGKPDELEKELEAIAKRYQGNRRTSHFLNHTTGQTLRSAFSYHGAKMALSPSESLQVPDHPDDVLVLPTRREHRFDIGDQLPLDGNLRVRVLAGRTDSAEESFPSLRLRLGFQASNDSNTSVTISRSDVAILASAEHSQMYEWVIPLADIPRNPYRGETSLGDLPNPAEYLVLENANQGNAAGAIEVGYLELTAPYYLDWPPESHRRVFSDATEESIDDVIAAQVIESFMTKAWRRSVTSEEVDKKLGLYRKLSETLDNSQDAVLEVLATVLSSPQFLYVSHPLAQGQAETNATSEELGTNQGQLTANRLALFLWASLPDDQLNSLASEGALKNEEVVVEQIERMLADPRSERFAKHFVHQWLGMELLENFHADKKTFPWFDHLLKESMQAEPVEYFLEVLRKNESIVDFMHSDYAVLNERLAAHYGIPNVRGNEFRRVSLSEDSQRGGILTQAGLLAMNSDGKDSHPLKRGIWMLENLLNDPPPPPPPAVPEIDLADPEIAKMSLKERIEDHRNQPACQSCHAKIDPWGIAFENFDATGTWRTEIGGKPVDANSLLFNDQELNGIVGLKHFLLKERQDQFVNAFVHKLLTYALGRPLSFGDRAAVDGIASKVRSQDDRLVDLIKLIVLSELFQNL